MKSVGELGHSDLFIIYVDPNKITLTLTFKSIQMTNFLKPLLSFCMQHYQTAGLQSDKIQPGRESKMATVTKNSKTSKNYFFSRTTIWLNFVWCIIGTFTFIFRIVKMKKILSRIRSQ